MIPATRSSRENIRATQAGYADVLPRAGTVGPSARETADERVVEIPTRAPWPTMDIAAIHGVLGEFVRAVDPVTEADPAAVALSVLTGFGNALNRGPHVMAGAARHALTLFTVIVGESSKARKGTAQRVARSLLRGADPEWAQLRVTTGLSSGEGLIWEVRDPVSEMKRVKTDGGGFERQSEITDEGVRDKRRLVVQEEFASTLRVMARDGNTLSAILRQAWDGDVLRSMTKNSPATATDAHVSLLGHITAEELRRELTETESANGFGNRFLFCCAQRSKSLPEGGTLDRVLEEHFAARVHTALDFGRKTGEIKRDDAARAYWSEIYGELSEGAPGLVGAVTSRAEAQVVRLAALFAVLDCSPAVCVEHLQAALQIWGYCEQSARVIFGASIGGGLADKVLTLLDSGGPMTRTDIRDALQRHASSADIDAALQALSSAGLASATREATKGRPRETWKCSR